MSIQPKEIEIFSKDGIKIPAFFYDNHDDNHDNESEPVKGIVIIVHGFGEYSGSYRELAENFAKKNYASVIFDQRGHGSLYGEKLRGIIKNYDIFLDDIDAVLAEIKKQKPNIPVILYGHSMGGNIAANYLLMRNQSDFSCAILESPWFGLYKEVSPVLAGIAKVLGSLSPNFAIVNNLPPDDVVSDKTKLDEMNNDPFYHNRISFRMFAGINKACKYAIKNAGKLSVPTYLAFAENEKIVSNTAIQKFYGSCESNVKLYGYESNHAVHNDGIREKYYKDIIAFMDLHCL